MYKFTKLQDPHNKFDLAEIAYTIDAEVASDIVDYFYYFMVGCGFGKEGVLNAFETVIENNKEEE